MYLHLGGEVVVSLHEIVGVFDIRTMRQESTQEFLRVAYEEGFVIRVGEANTEKSFIISNKNRVYYSPIASNTLRKRWKTFSLDTHHNGP